MTTFLLIRHAAHGLLGKVLAGRMPGVSLSEQGQTQAEELSRALGRLPVSALYSSPMQRCRETAQCLATQLEIPVQVECNVQEIDFGNWTGASFDSLRTDEVWNEWNAARSRTRAPGGETMAEAQGRLIATLERWSRQHDGETVAVVSHGDLVRSVVLHCRGESLDDILSFEVDPASVTVVGWSRTHQHLLLLNGTGAQAAEALRPAAMA